MIQECDLEYHSIDFLIRIWIIPFWDLPIFRSVIRLASTKLVIRTVFPIGGGKECGKSSGYPAYKLTQLPSIVLKFLYSVVYILNLMKVEVYLLR